MVERKRKRKEKNLKGYKALKPGIYREDTCGNKNVPTGSIIYGTLVGGNGDILFTFYKHEGKIWKVNDWMNNIPKPSNSEDVKRHINVDIDDGGKVVPSVVEGEKVRKIKETTYVKPEDDFVRGKYTIG